jgi:hypothetical protein
VIRIDVEVRGEEAIVRLETLPRRLRDFLEARLSTFLMTSATERLLSRLPGKFLDPRHVVTDVQTVGSLLIGSLEYIDKLGTYPIPRGAPSLLRFIARSGDIVFTRHVDHPFLKGGPVIERYFRENKPWLIEQIEDFVFEAVYNAR